MLLSFTTTSTNVTFFISDYRLLPNMLMLLSVWLQLNHFDSSTLFGHSQIIQKTGLLKNLKELVYLHPT